LNGANFGMLALLWHLYERDFNVALFGHRPPSIGMRG
jgi:hypothetical protein